MQSDSRVCLGLLSVWQTPL